MVVGAFADKYRGVRSGTAYIYEVSTGKSLSFVNKIFPESGYDDDFFGWSVSCDTNYTVIGAYGNDGVGKEAGAVFIYVESKGKWVQNVILYADDAAAGDYFGWSVATHAGVIVVGAIGQDAFGMDAGLVYTFVRDNSATASSGSGDGTWKQEATISCSNASPYAYFGWSVSIYQSRMLVGAPWKDLRRGAGYLYYRNETSVTRETDDDDYVRLRQVQYVEVEELQAPERNYRDFFGSSLAVYRDTIAIGAHMGLNAGINSGSVFLFKCINGKWKYVQKVTGQLHMDQITYFGFSVALYENTLVIGAPGSPDSGNSSLHILSEDLGTDRWRFQAVLEGPSGVAGEGGSAFGVSVAIGPDLAVVGAEKDEGLNAEPTGSVFLYFPASVFQRSLLGRMLSQLGVAGVSVLASVSTLLLAAAVVFGYLKYRRRLVTAGEATGRSLYDDIISEDYSSPDHLQDQEIPAKSSHSLLSNSTSKQSQPFFADNKGNAMDNSASTDRSGMDLSSVSSITASTGMHQTADDFSHRIKSLTSWLRSGGAVPNGMETPSSATGLEDIMLRKKGSRRQAISKVSDPDVEMSSVRGILSGL